jgi:hypothetical protein
LSIEHLLFGIFMGTRFQDMGKICGSVVILVISLCLVCGCQPASHERVLGKVPKGDLRNIVAIYAGDTPALVTVTGKMIEKCPVSGCWFRVQDGTGTIKVDTKAAGFVVVNVPLESKVTVSGKVVIEGDESIIEAAGLSY